MMTPTRVAAAAAAVLTPSEAGRRAADLARKTLQSVNAKRSLESPATLVAHVGIERAAVAARIHADNSYDNCHSKRGDKVGASSLVPSQYGNLPLAPPLHLATTYSRPPEGDYHPNDAIYTRMDNPTRRLLEREITALECHGGCGGVENQHDIQTDVDWRTCAFGSGLMAASSIILAHRLPLHVILPKDMYHGISSALHNIYASRWGVQVHVVDLRSIDELSEILRIIPSSDNMIVWLETPSNPLLHVLDIHAVVTAVRSISPHGTVVVDSTLAPPLIVQQPLLLGADVVMHSATKGLAGHSDALIGVVTVSPWTTVGKDLWPRLQQVQVEIGGVASPWDSWLTLRGMRTLAVRIQQQCQTAQQLATWLQETSIIHPYLKAVHYPGLTSHPGHTIALQQMKNNMFGSVLSIELSSEAAAMAFAGATTLIHRATSLGGTETVIEHRSSIEPPGRVTSPPGLLRISVGLEQVEDLIGDIQQALDIVDKVMNE